MKASELIEKLQEEIKYFGDRELKASCDCNPDQEGDGMFDIGDIGWFGDGEQCYITLICAECSYMRRLEHIQAKYEPEY